MPVTTWYADQSMSSPASPDRKERHNYNKGSSRSPKASLPPTASGTSKVNQGGLSTKSDLERQN